MRVLLEVRQADVTKRKRFHLSTDATLGTQKRLWLVVVGGMIVALVVGGVIGALIRGDDDKVKEETSVAIEVAEHARTGPGRRRGGDGLRRDR